MCLESKVYVVELDYSRSQRQLDFIVMDSHTHCAGTQLLVEHNIHTHQLDHCTLVFDSHKDAVFSLLVLSSPLYTCCLRGTTDGSYSARYSNYS